MGQIEAKVYQELLEKHLGTERTTEKDTYRLQRLELTGICNILWN